MRVFAGNGGANWPWRVAEPRIRRASVLRLAAILHAARRWIRSQKLSQQQLKQLSQLSGIEWPRLINSSNALKNHDSSAAILLACRLLIISSRHANRPDALAAN
jgi:hypothetical protein